jgi:hypothetical protein
MWRLVEPIHATIYFGSEAVAAAAQAGYRGFWMGYFALRLAPLGAVGPEVATAVCYGFAPARVGRALPDAWDFAGPEDALEARLAGATATLSRVAASVPGLPEAAELIWDAALHARTTGRVLAAANQALPRPDGSMGVIWQAATTLREHRGDGHNAALVAADVTPVQAHVLKVAAGETDARTLTISRGWPEDAWQAGQSELQERRWLDPDGTLTAEGRAAREGIEHATDLAAASPWKLLGPSNVDRLARLLIPLTDAIQRASLIPYPNPIGLPAAGV